MSSCRSELTKQNRKVGDSPLNIRIIINCAHRLLQSMSIVVCHCCLNQTGIKLHSWICPQALIPLALEGTAEGKVKASHAIAKIAAISNPEIAFPGERVRNATITALFISITLYL